jgi:DivIVA domain-containing protein
MNDDKLWHPMTASRIRTASFPMVRHGYDPKAVRGFLEWLADEVLRLQRRLAEAHTETERLKRHLRQWQREHATCSRAQPPNRSPHVRRDRWPINGKQIGRPPTTSPGGR